MTGFSVDPYLVASAGATLSGLAGEVMQAHGRVGGCSGAAAGTPADGAVEDLLSQWGSMLPRFAMSSSTLSTAVSMAGRLYFVTDADIAAGARAEPER